MSDFPRGETPGTVCAWAGTLVHCGAPATWHVLIENPRGLKEARTTMLCTAHVASYQARAATFGVHVYEDICRLPESSWHVKGDGSLCEIEPGSWSVDEVAVTELISSAAQP